MEKTESGNNEEPVKPVEAVKPVESVEMDKTVKPVEMVKTDKIGFNEFMRLDIRIGRVLTAEKLEGADKLIKLRVDTGSEERTIVAGIAPHYSPQDLPGMFIPVLCNLEPRKIRGEISSGMILAADEDGVPVLLAPGREVRPGSRVR